MPAAPTARTVPPERVKVLPVSRGELSARAEEKTVSSPPVMLTSPLESRPSPLAASA